MAEIENHTIRLLQELRDEMRSGFAGIEKRIVGVESKMNEGFEHLADEIDDVKRAISGETVLGRYAAKGVDDRLSELERRMSALEQARG